MHILRMMAVSGQVGSRLMKIVYPLMIGGHLIIIIIIIIFTFVSHRNVVTSEAAPVTV